MLRRLAVLSALSVAARLVTSSWLFDYNICMAVNRTASSLFIFVKAGNILSVKRKNQLAIKRGIVENGYQRVILRAQGGIAVNIDALDRHIRCCQQRRSLATKMATEADIKQIRHEHHQEKQTVIVLALPAS